jgi:hypothetical protein
LSLGKWSHDGGEAGAALGGGARRGGGGLIAFILRRKKARVARWAAWAERAMKPGGPGWWDGGLGDLDRPAGQSRRSGRAG